GGTAVAADVCDHGARRALVAAAAEALGGGIDLVVSSVGYADLRPLADTGEDAWHATLEANVVGVNLLVRELLPHPAPRGVPTCWSASCPRPWPPGPWWPPCRPSPPARPATGSCPTRRPRPRWRRRCWGCGRDRPPSCFRRRGGGAPRGGGAGRA